MMPSVSFPTLHCSANNDIAGTAERVHVPPVPASAAEEVELFRLRPRQHHQMPARRDDVFVVAQGARTIAGAIACGIVRRCGRSSASSRGSSIVGLISQVLYSLLRH